MIKVKIGSTETDVHLRVHSERLHDTVYRDGFENQDKWED